MWQIFPKNLELTRQNIHVWRVNLDLPSLEVEELAAVLSQDEIVRANRFYFAQHRQRFIVARGMLRKILGRYLDIEPDQVQFEYSSRGKPSLSPQFSASKIQFNISHSQGMALCGITCDRLIGIDLEYLRSLADAESIAKRFFSLREHKIISSLPAATKEKVFFQFWTAKEAYLKATGDGLSGGLEQVEVDINSDQSLRLVSIQGDYQKANNWSLYPLIPDVNYIATLAIETW